MERKEKLRVRVKLNSIVMRLNNDGLLLATLTLSTADVAVMLRGESIRVAARLGSLSLVDNVQRNFASPEFAKLLAIEGDELADFTYETFDPNDGAAYPGYDTSIWLRTGSLRFTFLEEPVRELMQFFMRFAQMKSVYDAATLAASAQASQLQQRVPKMHYDVVIKTPIVILPRDPSSADMFVANLGEIYAHNTFQGPDDQHVVTKIEAGLRHIRLASRLHLGSQEYRVQMIDDVNLSVNISQSEHLDHKPTESEPEPDMQISARLSDVNIVLTEPQYCLLMAVVEAIPRAFVAEEDPPDSTSTNAGTQKPSPSPKNEITDANGGAAVDMLPELGTVAHQQSGEIVAVHTTLDLLFTVHAIQIELFTAAATSQESLANASLARFALNDAEVKLKMLADAALEAEVALKSFTVHDTRPEKETRFREIVPAVRHDGHQFMLSYSQSANSALALVTIDSPKIIFSLDPMFALINFFTAPFDSNTAEAQSAKEAEGKPSATPSTAPRTGTQSVAKVQEEAELDYSEPALAYRVNVVAPTIVLLARPEKADTEAIVLSIKQVLMSQQGILALTVDQFGVFMCRMNKPKDTVRFLDNFNLTFSMDSRAMGLRQKTSIEVDVEPLVLRVAYRDIMLISSVINKAIELSSQSSADSEKESVKQPRRQASLATTTSVQSIDTTKGRTIASRTGRAASGTASSDDARLGAAHLIMSKESLKASFAGLQVIVIGDVHSLPLIDMNVSKFGVDVQDWSGDMKVDSTLNLYLNYYNLSRSHWEPFIDPWTLNFAMSTTSAGGDASTSMTVSSKRRLELNLTSTLIETALTSAAIMNDESGKASGLRNAAPFRIRNRTGYRISIWPEHEDRRIKPQTQHLDDGNDLPWRFDDWKVMREVSRRASKRAQAID